MPDGGAKAGVQARSYRFDSGPPHKYFQFIGCIRPPATAPGVLFSRKTRSNMNNFVSYETALRLRDAGFPQPEPEAGQFWYDPYGTPDVVTDVDEWHVFSASLTDVTDYTNAVMHDEFTAGWHFAPGPAEILREIPDHVCGNNKGSKGGYWCGRYDDQRASFHENMAEACAAQWLSIHNKNNK